MWRGEGEGPECHCSEGNRRFWADSGPDPRRNLLFICILALGAAGTWAGDAVRTTEIEGPDPEVVDDVSRPLASQSVADVWRATPCYARGGQCHRHEERGPVSWRRTPPAGSSGDGNTCNSASGLEIGLPGRILAGLLPGKHRNRPAGRPSASRRADFGAFPVAVHPKSGPEGRFPARKHYCAT